MKHIKNIALSIVLLCTQCYASPIETPELQTLFDHLSEQLELSDTNSLCILDELIAQSGATPTESMRQQLITNILEQLVILNKKHMFTSPALYHNLARQIIASCYNNERLEEPEDSSWWQNKKNLILLALFFGITISISIAVALKYKANTSGKSNNHDSKAAKKLRKEVKQTAAAAEKLRHKINATHASTKKLQDEAKRAIARSKKLQQKVEHAAASNQKQASHHKLQEYQLQEQQKQLHALGMIIKKTNEALQKDKQAMHDFVKASKRSLKGLTGKFKDGKHHYIKWLGKMEKAIKAVCEEHEEYEKARPWYDRVIPDFELKNTGEFLQLAGTISGTLGGAANILQGLIGTTENAPAIPQKRKARK